MSESCQENKLCVNTVCNLWSHSHQVTPVWLKYCRNQGMIFQREHSSCESPLWQPHHPALCSHKTKASLCWNHPAGVCFIWGRTLVRGAWNWNHADVKSQTAGFFPQSKLLKILSYVQIKNIYSSVECMEENLHKCPLDFLPGWSWRHLVVIVHITTYVFQASMETWKSNVNNDDDGV